MTLPNEVVYVDINYFKAIHGAIGEPNRAETNRQKVIREVERDFNKSLDVDTFNLWDKEIQSDIRWKLNTYNKEFSSVVGQKQDFTCLNNVPIQCGDVLYNPREDMYWLVIYVNQADYIYKRGLLYRCSYKLKWKDNDGNIWEYPCHDINATQYNSGIDQGRQIDYVSSQHKITLTADSNTVNLPIDKRFFLGKGEIVPDVYRITQNDSSSSNFDKGLVILTLLRDMYDPDYDDIQNRLCGDKVPSQDQPREGSDIEFEGNPNILIGNTKTLSTKLISGATWRVLETSISPYIEMSVIETGDLSTVTLHIGINEHTIELADNSTSFELEYVASDETVLARQNLLIIGGY